jgi:hypothetical protein
MIRICYSVSEGCVIFGAPARLRVICRRIRQIAAAQAGSAVIDTEINFNPQPYEHALSLLALSIGSGPVRALVEGSELYIRGSHGALEALSSFFDIADDAAHGHRVRHVYQEGHPHIAPDSVPLAISVSLPPA